MTQFVNTPGDEFVHLDLVLSGVHPRPPLGRLAHASR